MSTKQLKQPDFLAYQWADIAVKALEREGKAELGMYDRSVWLPRLEDLCRRCEANGYAHPYSPEELLRLAEARLRIDNADDTGSDRTQAIVDLLAGKW